MHVKHLLSNLDHTYKFKTRSLSSERLQSSLKDGNCVMENKSYIKNKIS